MKGHTRQPTESVRSMWLSTKDIPLRGGTKKLTPGFVGPFSIIRVISPTAVHLRLPATMRQIHPTFHVSRLKPAVTHALCPDPPPAPCIIDGGETYTVSKLLDSHRRGLQYLIDWEGYGPEERSWTPARFILDKRLITFTVLTLYHRSRRQEAPRKGGGIVIGLCLFLLFCNGLVVPCFSLDWMLCLFYLWSEPNTPDASVTPLGDSRV